MPKDIANWLEELGLEEYAGSFAENAIDGDVLPDLTDADLEKIGVKLGHRKKLLKAIAALADPPSSGGSPIAGESAPRHDASGVGLAAWERHPGERKPVTMLFADITGSTALTEKLDAEETHDVLFGAIERMCDAVERHRGLVCRFMGDGVMALFGAPVASEHHAVDACAAACEMQQSMHEYATGIAAQHDAGIQIRVGVHSGEVVVLTVGEGDKKDYDVTGPNVPIAARLEQVAEPGEIYISATTRALAASRIETEKLEPVSVKGISEPVPVFALRRVASAEESVVPERRTSFVGRRAELNLFRGILDSCIEQGQGQAVYVRGDPGIGKTRLTEEFIRIGAEKGVGCHRGLVLDFGVARGQDAVRALVRSLIDLPLGSSGNDRVRAADVAIEDGDLEPGQRVFLNDLLDLPQPIEFRALYDAMDNATRNAGKQEVVSTLVGRTSARHPVMLVVEDVHWADSVTLAYLSSLTKSVAECPALLLMTSRIEGDPLDQRWRGSTDGSPLATIDLGPLREQESRQLIEGFFDAEDPIAADCLERAAGNPLFLEQLLRSAAEGSVEGLPDSIQSLVIARMDRLDPGDKQALQAASIIGQRFNVELLRHLLDADDYDCHALLEHNLVRPEGAEFLFAHALIQECVYGSLLKRERRKLHGKAADWYSGHDAALRAEHLAGAEDAAAPSAFLEAAAEEFEQYRFERALEMMERGLAISTSNTDRHRLNCLKGALLNELGNTEPSIAVYQEALEQAEEDVQRCDAWIGLAAGMRMTTSYEAGLELLDKAEPVARANDLKLELARLYHLRGNLCFPLGRVEDCQEAHESALEFARESGSLEDEARALGGLGDAAYARGRMRTAYGHFSRCVELSREHGLGRVEIAHLAMCGFTLMYMGELEDALAAAVAAREAARRVGNLRVEMNSDGCICHLATDLGDVALMEAHAKQQMAAARIIGSRTWEPTALLWLAMASHRGGRASEAREYLLQAAEITREAGRAFNAGRVLGALALVAGDAEERDNALEEGERSLRDGALGHNHFWFNRFAMDALLAAGEWDRVEQRAAALEHYTRTEPLPWSDYFIARARALAAFGRGERGDATVGELRRVRDEAKRMGFNATLPELEAALAATTS